MNYVTLNNGVKMPQMSYGVYQVAPKECERCVGEAIKKCGVPINPWFSENKVHGFIDNKNYS